MITRSYISLTFDRNVVKFLCISSSDGLGGIWPRPIKSKFLISVLKTDEAISDLLINISDNPFSTGAPRTLCK
ncbi:hypothetical protein D3C84_1202390 [compost metagenome]